MNNNLPKETDVIEFLSSHPDFFVKNPQLLEQIQVANSSGNMTSLSNHQINALKDQNIQLKQKLADLIQLASDNERLMTTIFEVALNVGQYSNLSNVMKCFLHYVKKLLSPDWISVMLPADPSLNSIHQVIQIDESQAIPIAFEEFIHNDKAVCGRLPKQMVELLLSESATDVGSGILLPIGKQADKGMIFFASKDESRFHPDMSTDLLMRLAQILDSKLKTSLNYQFAETVES